MVSFTGSTASGIATAKSASASVKPVVLELGGEERIHSLRRRRF